MTAIAEIAPEVREMAAKTAAEVRRRGWVQGTYYDAIEPVDDCAVCLVGAILFASKSMPGLTPPAGPATDLVRALNAAIGKAPAVDWDYDGHLISWNDEHGRTRSEVLDLLDSIANG